MKPLEAPRTIESILRRNGINVVAFSRYLTEYVPANIDSPLALAEINFQTQRSGRISRLGEIAGVLVDETLGKRKLELSGSEHSFATYIEMVTLLFGGLTQRKMGMIEQNHPFSTAYSLMAKGGTYTEYYAAKLHDLVENSAKDDTERVRSILHLYKAMNHFVKLRIAKEDQTYFRRESTKIAIITDLLTQKREIDYNGEIGEEHYNDFMDRITRLPRDHQTLKLYKHLGLFEMVKGEHGADEMIDFIRRWGWDKKSNGPGEAGSVEKKTLVEQAQNLRRFFISSIILPAMNVKLEDRRDNTIKVEAFKARVKSFTPARQNRSNNAKNLIDTIPRFKAFVENLEGEDFDRRRTYQLMEDLCDTTEARIDYTIESSIFSGNSPSTGRYLRGKMRDFRIATSLYRVSGGFDKATRKGETKMPWYVPRIMLSPSIRKAFHDLDGITAEYAVYERKLLPVPSSVRKEDALQHLVAFKKLAQLLRSGMMPVYDHSHEYLIAFASARAGKIQRECD